MSNLLDRLRAHGPARRGSRFRHAAIGVLLVVLPSQVLAADSGSLVRSLLIPGSGQAHQGHYAKAAVFAGSFVFFGFGLFLTQVQYNSAVDKYDDSITAYGALGQDVANGEIVSIVDLQTTYNTMTDAFDQSENRLTWRNVFLTGFIVTYSLNIIDVLMSRPHDSDTARGFSIEADLESVALVRTFRF